MILRTDSTSDETESSEASTPEIGSRWQSLVTVIATLLWYGFQILTGLVSLSGSGDLPSLIEKAGKLISL